MGLEFANPAMLLGTLLFGVPLIIHLLNKRRYKMKRWAAMNFLMDAYKRTRRRLRLENFLLLLLRCLIIILLALAMAKPFVSSESAMAALTSVRREVVVVLDNSYSMGYQLSPDETCFEAAKKQITALIGRLDGGRGDTVTMILMGANPEIVVPYHSPPDTALARLDRLRSPSPQGADFSAVAQLLAGELAANLEGMKEVYIFTDLQARILGNGPDQARGSTAALLRRAVEKGAEIRLVDVGRQTPCPPNLAVTDVVTMESYVTTEIPTTFMATVRNFSDQEVPDCRGTFLLDGKALESRSLNLKAGGTATATSILTVQDAGYHNISFRLDQDNLPLDDERWYAFDARHTVQILLVDGRFSDDPLESATGELCRVINPVRMDGGQDRGTVFDPVVMDFKIFNAGRADLDLYDCIILANVEGLSAEMSDSLLNFTRNGGGLVFFMGDQVDLSAYNQRFAMGEEPHLLPAPLEEVMGDALGREGVNFFKLTVPDLSHPIFEVFNDPRYRLLLDVPIFRFIRVGELEVDARVVAWFQDTLDRSYPGVIEKNLGKGRVVLITTSASSAWSLLPESPVTFLPLVHNLLYYLTSRDTSQFNLNVGDRIRRTVADFPEKVALLDPDGSRNEISEPVEHRVFDRFLLPLDNTPLAEPGPYFLEVDFSLTGRKVGEYYAANVDSQEGNLRRFEADSLDTLFPDCRLQVVENTLMERGEGEGGTGRGEIWPALLIMLLAVVGLEMFLAWKFGNYA